MSTMTPAQIADAVLRATHRARTAEARLAEVEAVVVRVEALADKWWTEGDEPRDSWDDAIAACAADLRAALDGGGQP